MRFESCALRAERHLDLVQIAVVPALEPEVLLKDRVVVQPVGQEGKVDAGRGENAPSLPVLGLHRLGLAIQFHGH